MRIATLLVPALFVMVQAKAGIVTLVANTNETVELNLSQYETAELISYPYTANSFGTLLDVVKDGKTITIMAASAWPAPQSTLEKLVLAGPAKIRFKGGYQTGLCSFNVTPEAFPPDRTILVPPGTNQAQITLECSTNLVNWFATTNGIYGPLPEAKFFRIKLDKLQ